MADSEAFRLNDDGTAVDPIAFRNALRADPKKCRQLEDEDPEMAEAVLGEDTDALQEVLKSIYAELKSRYEEDNLYALTSSDKMRAQCTVPRDPAALYEQMLQVGLQYGPAFRLLSDVFVPESVANES